MNDRDRASDRTLLSRRDLGLALALVGAAAAVGAVLGAVLSSQVGLEEVVVLEITFTISPVAVALYSGVTIGTFLVTLLFVVEIISKFDDRTL